MSSNIRRNQAGMVSIMVTLIMMIVISLIVIGFSEVSRRNQRETLDRQLSTQAFYAAETGVNDAVEAITSGAIPVTSASNFDTDCGSFIQQLTLNGVSNDVDGSNGVAYTCLLVNNAPKTVSCSVSLGATCIKQLSMDSSDGTLTFSWQINGAAAGLPQCPNTATVAAGTAFKPNTAAGWNTCPYGVLRVDLYHDTGSGYDPATMATATDSLYIVPTSNGNNAPGLQPSLNSPLVVGNTRCTATTCTATIKGLASGTAAYYARISGIYQGLGKVTISGGPATTFSGVLTIDATGRAQDQLRRIRVEIPLSGASGPALPIGAVESTTGICKRFGIAGPGTTADSGNATNPLCDQNTE